MKLDNYADKPVPRAKRKAGTTSKKPAAKKPTKTLYDVAIKNGWGPRLRVIPGALDRLKKTPA